jgi:hypothetical protein
VEVVVDGRTGLVTPESGTTFRTIFEALHKAASLRRRVVVSLTLDGETLTRERQSDLSGQAPGEYGLLEVRTMDPFEFSLGTLTGLLGHLKNMDRSHDEAEAAVAAGEYAKALEKFESCFHGWDVLVRAVRDVGALSSADFQSLRAGDEVVEVRIRDVQETLLRFTAALEFKDVLRIGDIVRDELKPQLAEWRRVIDALSQHVARISGAAQG